MVALIVLSFIKMLGCLYYIRVFHSNKDALQGFCLLSLFIYMQHELMILYLSVLTPYELYGLNFILLLSQALLIFLLESKIYSMVYHSQATSH